MEIFVEKWDASAKRWEPRPAIDDHDALAELEFLKSEGHRCRVWWQGMPFEGEALRRLLILLALGE